MRLQNKAGSNVGFFYVAYNHYYKILAGIKIYTYFCRKIQYVRKNKKHLV